ncbi:cupin domain-containing protein [Conexibacter stalactiti]|uniref:Cupin domain-containing protein n=1 Tax=Conexibacter stalactiti TaxID=1940611 RepID=A0ABU4HR22_9ACTN|nr:cupin domain-containing protein [Conexibacter stalactiti]MDW5594514.1 cupin domain-containing protein [Conexibacter stalactiti]MEC5035156.1 cupin domain-containing protein [Conexibacter stalactiti]
MHHVQFAADIRGAVPARYAGHVERFERAEIVGKQVGAVHTGFGLCALADGGMVGAHLHSCEESFFVLAGSPELTLDGRTTRLEPGACGIVPLGVEHSWRNRDGQPARWLEMTAPAPRLDDEKPDTFFTGTPLADGPVHPLDVRDPRSRTFFRLDAGQMDVDVLKHGAAVDAPQVSSSMATALLAYSGIAVKMLVDQRLGAALHTMFMVEYQPGGVAQPHDHPLEESYFILDGEVEAVADGERYLLRAGDAMWTGVGCIHAFYNTSDATVRWLETSSPQPPSNHSYRFDRDWDHLAELLGRG